MLEELEWDNPQNTDGKQLDSIRDKTVSEIYFLYLLSTLHLLVVKILQLYCVILMELKGSPTCPRTLLLGFAISKTTYIFMQQLARGS